MFGFDIQVIEALSTIVFDDEKVQRMITAFEEQINFANSPDENLRKKTDLFWENTYIRRLLDGNGKLTKRVCICFSV